MRLTLVLVPIAFACARDARPAEPPPRAVNPGTGAEVRGPGTAPGATTFLDPGAETFQRPVMEAIAVLHPTHGSDVRGTVRFVSQGQPGLDVFSAVEGLPPGPHAFHVHVYGDCSAPDARSAGPHFHFTGSSLDPHVEIITGDLGELVPGADGRTAHHARLPTARMHGRFAVLGRAVVVHEKGNDPEITPDGGAGARIACGVIGVAEPRGGEGQPTAAR